MNGDRIIIRHEAAAKLNGKIIGKGQGHTKKSGRTTGSI